MRRTGLLGAAAIASASVAQAQSPEFAWTQYVRGGMAVRAVVDGDTCPDLVQDGQATPMTPRSRNPPARFATAFVCEAQLAAGTQAASVEGVSVPVPVAMPRTVAVLGDTGCRVAKWEVQNCTGSPDGNSAIWRYPELAGAVAAAAPDLVVHVGDMHYREATAHCGANCVHGNIGRTWESWRADFFEPSRTLLAAAPLLPARGNHEDCGRAWTGWFYLLGPDPVPDPFPAACPSGEGTGGAADWYFTDPFAVDLGGLRAIVMDTSYLPDRHGTRHDQTVERYRGEFDTVKALVEASPDPVWLVTHRPFWGVASYMSGGVQQAAVTDRTLQAAIDGAWSGDYPAGLKAVFAGHIHLYERLGFGDGRPPQLVFGNSGTERDPALGSDGTLSAPTSRAVAQLGAEEFVWSHAFDYGWLERGTAGWTGSVRALDGKAVDSFTISD